MGYFSILGAIPGFFISSLLVWALWNPVARRVGWDLDITYVQAMLVTIFLWLAVAPLATVRQAKKK
ncbi:MAG: hypothetical protein JW990_14270 [Thermoleophilia bacterium]|nr:hypothetical protein [Thermoleophilia bacterium]